MSSETTTLVILIAILIASGVASSAFASFIAKRLAGQQAEREAEIAEAEKKHLATRLAEMRRAKILDSLPPRSLARHLPARMPSGNWTRAINPGPGLRPHPLHGKHSTPDTAAPWVIPPASMAYAPDMLGIGDTTGTDSDTRTAAVITTLCTPADVASTPGASGD